MTNEPTKGLMVHILRPANFPDCTAGGISALADRLTIVGTVLKHPVSGRDFVQPIPTDSRVFASTADRPAVALRNHTGRSIHLVPVYWDEVASMYVAPTKWYMAGGNYASLGDSRAYRAASAALGADFDGAVAIHDRNEGK